MKIPTSATLAVLFFAATALADWPQFRGPDSASVAPDARLPDSWGNEEGEENVAWRVDLPGRGPSSPIVVGDRVIVTCSSGPNQDRLHVLCFSAASGEKQWERQFWATGRTVTHTTSANAAPTPASDGEAVYAFFSSNDLACIELDGKLRWYRGLAYDFPRAGNDFGMSSSPLLLGETVIVQIECPGESFVAGIDRRTGETRWRLDRQRESSWASPIALPGAEANGSVVLFQAPGGVTAVDADRGEVLWTHAATCDGIPSSTADGNRVYVPADGVTALEIGAGSSPPEVAWTSSRLRPGAGSPVVHDGEIYTINSSGVLTCGDAETGEAFWQLRLEGRCWATPLIAGGRLYAINSDGKAFVVRLGEKGEIVGESDFGEVIQGSPAVSKCALFVRSDRHLWKIASPDETP